MEKPYTEEDYRGEFNILAMEKSVMIDALKASKGVIRDAAKLISGMTERTFFRKLHRHSLNSFVDSLVEKAKIDAIKSFGEIDKTFNKTLKHEFLTVTVEKILKKSK